MVYIFIVCFSLADPSSPEWESYYCNVLQESMTRRECRAFIDEASQDEQVAFAACYRDTEEDI